MLASEKKRLPRLMRKLRPASSDDAAECWIAATWQQQPSLDALHFEAAGAQRVVRR
jgi:hypothetical protein